MKCLLFALGCVLALSGASPAQGPPQAPMPPQAPPVADYQVYQLPSYAAVYDRAVAGTKPVVIHVNCEPGETCDWAVHCTATEVGGDKTPRVIVCVPEGGKLALCKVLSCHATAREIHDAVYPPRPYGSLPVGAAFPASGPQGFGGRGRSC